MLQGAYDLGWHLPYDLVHALEKPFTGMPVAGAFLAWLVNTLFSAILGLAWDLAVMAIVHPLLNLPPFGKKEGGHEEDEICAELAGYRPTKHDTDPAP